MIFWEETRFIDTAKIRFNGRPQTKRYHFNRAKTFKVNDAVCRWMRDTKYEGFRAQVPYRKAFSSCISQ
ncbi:hypothetical protein RRG08_036342 [Elysia crispata]|uniref:Uncharacterized protein n=1 Tax=Elysia crispata TaxID=231223 RepID=A0AAE1DJH2_9GAST|nr:hypothetical protein RRG08_036342 [Elysia crispata]